MRRRSPTLGLLFVSLWMSAFAAALQFPASVEVETGKLVFHVGKDLASLVKQTGSARIVKLRVFVGRPDAVVSVEQAIRETFHKRRQSLPVLTVVHVGEVPHSAAFIWESAAEGSSTVNTHGLAFIQGQPASAPEAGAPITPLAGNVLASLRTCVTASEVRASDVMRVTCLMSGLEELSAVRRSLEAEYGNAVFSYIQLQNKPTRTVIECEAVARLRASPGDSPRYINPEGLSPSPNYTHIVLTAAPRLVMTAMQTAKRADDADGRSAFQALQGVLARAGSDIRRVIMSNLYPTSPAASDLIRRIRFDFYERSYPPASTMMVYEGLPGDAAFAVDVVALPNLK